MQLWWFRTLYTFYHNFTLINKRSAEQRCNRSAVESLNVFNFVCRYNKCARIHVYLILKGVLASIAYIAVFGDEFNAASIHLCNFKANLYASIYTHRYVETTMSKIYQHYGSVKILFAVFVWERDRRNYVSVVNGDWNVCFLMDCVWRVHVSGLLGYTMVHSLTQYHFYVLIYLHAGLWAYTDVVTCTYLSLEIAFAM